MKYKNIIPSLLREISSTRNMKNHITTLSLSEFDESQYKDKNISFQKITLPAPITLETESNNHADAQILEKLHSWEQSHHINTTNALCIEDTVYVIQPYTLSHNVHMMNNKVVLITGSAQGLGKEIAEHLVSYEAIVFIADINKEQAEKTALEIRKKYHKENNVHALPLNCTDETSVEKCVSQVVKKFGGIDVLISNAGIVISGDIESLSISDFMKVTEVNYYGYFLLVKHVSPYMKYHHYANSSYYGDIIQINSKSGLVGSLKNSAYAGSKFGGIGLTQSFALELVTHNIKVNAICPGNFYDGPLWSDPHKGLFKQYLEAGKIPTAHTIEDVRKAYEEKTPMKRGCTPQDVVKGILYLIDQKFETGQALPISGGQIMLH